MPAKQPDIEQLVKAILESYDADDKTRHVDSAYLPSRDAAIELIDLMRELLFPGFFGRQDLTSRNIQYHVGDLIGNLHQQLFEQIRNAIRHDHIRKSGSDCPECDTSAMTITEEFLGTLPRIRQLLATDVQAAFDGDPAAQSFDEIIFSYPGFYAITVQRLAHELWRLGVPLIPRIMTEHAHSLTGIDIHPGAGIGEYFFIDHGTGVVIGETTTIGNRVKIYQGVTLGAMSTRGGQTLRGAKRHPTIEDEVTIYPGASVLGGETTIGTGATIASNAFVTQSVPAGTRVSPKNPELQYKNRPPQDFQQNTVLDWQI